MNKYLYILGLAGVALFSACSNSDDLSIEGSPAVDKAKEYGLYYDDEVQLLLETRNPRYGNRQTSSHIKFELTRELNSSLDIAFNLKVANVFGLNANYNQLLIERKKIEIETKIVF